MLYFLTCCVALHTAVNIGFLSKKWKRQIFIQNFDFSLNSFLKISNNLISKFKNKTLRKNSAFSTKKLTYVSLCEQCLFFEKCSIYCRLHLRAIIRVLCQYFAAWIENCCRCYRRPRPGILLRSFWQMGILPSHKRQPIKMFGLLMANSVWRTIVASMICQNF